MRRVPSLLACILLGGAAVLPLRANPPQQYVVDTYTNNGNAVPYSGWSSAFQGQYASGTPSHTTLQGLLGTPQINTATSVRLVYERGENGQRGPLAMVVFQGPQGQYAFFPGARVNAEPSAPPDGLTVRIASTDPPLVPQKVEGGSLQDVADANLGQLRERNQNIPGRLLLSAENFDQALTQAAHTHPSHAAPSATSPPASYTIRADQTSAQPGELYRHENGVTVMLRAEGGEDREHGYFTTGGMLFIHQGRTPQGPAGTHPEQDAYWYLYTADGSRQIGRYADLNVVRRNGAGNPTNIVIQEGQRRVDLSQSFYTVPVQQTPTSSQNVNVLAFHPHQHAHTFNGQPLHQYVAANGARYAQAFNPTTRQVVVVPDRAIQSSSEPPPPNNTQPVPSAQLDRLLTDVRDKPKAQTLAAVQALARSGPWGDRTTEVVNHLLTAATQPGYSPQARQAAVTALVDLAHQHPEALSPSAILSLAGMIQGLPHVPEADRAALQAHVRTQLARLNLGDLGTLATAPGTRLSRFTATFQAMPQLPYLIYKYGATPLGPTNGIPLWAYNGGYVRFRGDMMAQLPSGDFLMVEPLTNDVYRLSTNGWNYVGAYTAGTGGQPPTLTGSGGAITDMALRNAVGAVLAGRTQHHWQEPPGIAQDLGAADLPGTSAADRAAALRRLLSDDIPSGDRVNFSNTLANYLHHQSRGDFASSPLANNADNQRLFMEVLTHLMDRATANTPTASRASISGIVEIYSRLPADAAAQAFRNEVRAQLNRLSSGANGFQNEGHDLAHYLDTGTHVPPAAAWTTWVTGRPFLN